MVYTNFPTRVQRINETTLEDHSLGSRVFRKTHVDCRLLTSRSRWGTVEQKRAGLLFLQLEFNQPRDCRMKQVTINMEFSSPSDKECHPIIKKHAPASMCGEEFQQHATKNTKLAPEITIGSFGGGSLGETSKSLDYTQSFRWLFTGHKRANDNAQYTKLVWTLDDQEEGAVIPFSRPITAAVILSISDPRPFNVFVSVKGELRSVHQRLKDLHFRSRDPSVSNELRPMFSQPLTCLDAVSEKLEDTIRDENRRHWIPEYKTVQPDTSLLETRAPAPAPAILVRLLGGVMLYWNGVKRVYTSHDLNPIIFLLATMWNNLLTLLGFLRANQTP